MKNLIFMMMCILCVETLFAQQENPTLDLLRFQATTIFRLATNSNGGHQAVATYVNTDHTLKTVVIRQGEAASIISKIQKNTQGELGILYILDEEFSKKHGQPRLFQAMANEATPSLDQQMLGAFRSMARHLFGLSMEEIGGDVSIRNYIKNNMDLKSFVRPDRADAVADLIIKNAFGEDGIVDILDTEFANYMGTKKLFKLEPLNEEVFRYAKGLQTRKDYEDKKYRESATREYLMNNMVVPTDRIEAVLQEILKDDSKDQKVIYDILINEAKATVQATSTPPSITGDQEALQVLKSHAQAIQGFIHEELGGDMKARNYVILTPEMRAIVPADRADAVSDLIIQNAFGEFGILEILATEYAQLTGKPKLFTMEALDKETFLFAKGLQGRKNMENQEFGKSSAREYIINNEVVPQRHIETLIDLIFADNSRDPKVIYDILIDSQSLEKHESCRLND